MRGGTSLKLLWALLPIVAPSRAGAETAGASLSWQAPAECPQAGEFSGEVERLLGQPLDRERDQRLQIVGRVAARAGGDYAVELRVTGRLGVQRRALQHRDCAKLTEAAALITALAIDPELIVPEAQPATPEPEQAEAATPGASPPVAAAPARQLDTGFAQKELAATIAPAPIPSADAGPQPARESSPLRGSIAALGLLGTGSLPKVGVGFGARGELGARRFRVALDGAYWLSRFQGLQAETGPGIELGMWGVGLKACGLPLAGKVTLSGCLGPKIGDMYGRGNGLLENAVEAHGRWSALVAELSLAISARSGLMTLFGVELGRTLEAPRFGILTNQREREVFEAARWTFHGFVGFGQSR